MSAEPAPATGWEPDAPVDDTIVRQSILNFASMNEAIVASMGGRAGRHTHVSMTDAGSRCAFLNAAMLLQPMLPGDRAALDAIDEFYGDTTESPVTVWSAWPTPDLRAIGWELEGHPPLMLRPPGGVLPEPPSDLCVDEVTDGARPAPEATNSTRLDEFAQVVIDGFPIPELQPFRAGSFLDERVLGAGLRLWVGDACDRPVTSAAAYVAAGVVGVNFVATLPHERRRGYGEAVTWRATMAEPGLPAVLLASDPGRPVYARMGYLPVTRFSLWVRPPQRP
jgi:hypothetical protein